MSRVEDNLNRRILALYELLDRDGIERVSATMTSELNEEALVEILVEIETTVDAFADSVLHNESIAVQGLSPAQDKAARAAIASHLALIALSSVRDNYIVALGEENPVLAQEMSEILYKGL